MPTINTTPFQTFGIIPTYTSVSRYYVNGTTPQTFVVPSQNVSVQVGSWSGRVAAGTSDSDFSSLYGNHAQDGYVVIWYN
jgi:hypothetical protein